jgi:aryl-phospho-beta-D-glucosidase BglC (GH1 family)
MIKESDFSEMKQLGVNFVRLPLGYWNVFDMPYCPNAPTTDSNRMCNLKNIMPSYTYYRPYIDKVMNYAKKYGQKVLLDLHGAPGSQNGASHSGCSVSSVYWDTDWNKQNTLSAVKALAEICNANLASCYGIEVLNEPGWGVDRNHLISYYQDAIKTARQVLPAYVPVVVFEWNPYWYHYEGRWNSLFPYSTYGRVELDTHIYHFENTVW